LKVALSDGCEPVSARAVCLTSAHAGQICGLATEGFLVHRNRQGVKMNKKSGTSKASADRLVKTIRRKTRQTYSAEEKIRIVLAGLRGEESIPALCRREGISESLYYSWSKEGFRSSARLHRAVTQA
jgi:hypothetical protein